MGGGGRCRRHPDGDEGIRGGLLGRATLRWLAPVDWGGGARIHGSHSWRFSTFGTIPFACVEWWGWSRVSHRLSSASKSCAEVSDLR